MRGIYTANYTREGLGDSQTLMYLTAPATASVEILAAHVTNATNDNEEQIVCGLWRILSFSAAVGLAAGDSTAIGIPTNSSPGTSTALGVGSYTGSPTEPVIVIPTPHENGDQASSCIVKADPSSEPLYATNPVYQEAWSNLIGFHFEPIPETRILVPPSGSIGIRFINRTIYTFDAVIALTFREIG